MLTYNEEMRGRKTYSGVPLLLLRELLLVDMNHDHLDLNYYEEIERLRDEYSIGLLSNREFNLMNSPWIPLFLTSFIITMERLSIYNTQQQYQLYL